MCAYACVHAPMCAYACVHAPVPVCMPLCLCACPCACVHAPMCTCSYACVHAPMCACSYACVHAPMCACPYVHECLSACSFACVSLGYAVSPPTKLKSDSKFVWSCLFDVELFFSIPADAALSTDGLSGFELVGRHYQESGRFAN